MNKKNHILELFNKANDVSSLRIAFNTLAGYIAPGDDFYFCYIQMFFNSLEQPMSFLHNLLPENWRQVYASKNYHTIDPSWAHARRSVLPFYWSDLTQDFLTNQQQSMVADAQRHGLCSGVLLPFHGWAGFSLLWVMSRLPESDIRQELDQFKYHAWNIYPYLFEATSRVIFNNLSNLSRRETECLYWAAEGMNTEQISDQLFIATVTVEKHIKHACQKLNAKNRGHAVRIARDIGVFKPNEKSFRSSSKFNERDKIHSI